MNCEQVRSQDLVEKYVSGRLADPEMAAFEEHYFACDDCLAEVQMGQAVAAAQPVKNSKIVTMPLRGAVARPRWIYAAAAAAALVVVGLLGWRAVSMNSPSPRALTTAQHEVATPSNAVPQPAVGNSGPAPAL